MKEVGLLDAISHALSCGQRWCIWRIWDRNRFL